MFEKEVFVVVREDNMAFVAVCETLEKAEALAKDIRVATQIIRQPIL